MKKGNILIMCLIVIFIFTTIFVILKDTLKIDNFFYNFIISFKSDNVTYFFKMITKCANINFCVILLLVILILLRNKEAIFLIIITVDIELINLIMKFLIKRDRPNILRMITVSNYSYPSGHAMISAGIYGYLIYLIYKKVNNKILKIIGIILLSLLIILIGISRIYLGVHYFTDVLMGYTLSLLYLIIFVKVINNKKGIFDV